MTQCKVQIDSIDEVKEFSAIMNSVDYDIDLISGRYVVDAKSIMGIFSLDLTKALELNIHADGDAVADLMDEISKFVIK